MVTIYLCPIFISGQEIESRENVNGLIELELTRLARVLFCLFLGGNM